MNSNSTPRFRSYLVPELLRYVRWDGTRGLRRHGNELWICFIVVQAVRLPRSATVDQNVPWHTRSDRKVKIKNPSSSQG
jgi:hypothetical protein